MKRCPDCGETKPVDEFPRNRSTKDGLAAYCKPCHNQKMKEIAHRLYGGNANFLRMKRYGIDAESLKRMIEAEQGVCALCRERPARHVDHVHDTGNDPRRPLFLLQSRPGKIRRRPGDHPFRHRLSAAARVNWRVLPARFAGARAPGPP